MGSVKVEVNLPSIDKAEDFLRKKYIKTLGQAANNTVDMLKVNFSKGKTGAGQTMPALDEKYRNRKANHTGRFRRDLMGVKDAGAMLGGMHPKKKGSDTWIITFSAAELEKARGNQDILNKKGGMRFMSVNTKWIEKVTEFFNKAMKRYMR